MNTRIPATADAEDDLAQARAAQADQAIAACARQSLQTGENWQVLALYRLRELGFSTQRAQELVATVERRARGSGRVYDGLSSTRPCPHCGRPSPTCWIMPCLELSAALSSGAATVNRWLDSVGAPFNVAE